ncbi:hypothetical protein [Rubellimicrobium sp. CFH 75288]|nr:hypothetical protein [Rubellimicrobium sp. CFH 75288]
MVTKHDDAKVVIYRPWITTKDGRKIWAKWFGKKAFRIEVDPYTETT